MEVEPSPATNVLEPKFALHEQFKSLVPLLSRPSAQFAPPNFDTEEEDALEYIASDEVKVLVVGAGGLGCELLKDLALSGFRDIEVVDLDTIALSNLNRQFLFREKDVGMPKSQTAAKFVMERVPGCKIVPHHKPLQEFDSDFYSQFNVVIAGLDNVKARRWLNAKLFSLVEYDENNNVDIDTLIPLIDGGTEGFKGHVRMFLPGLSSCFECSLAALPPQTGFALCTLQGKPRKPEHCVAYAKSLLWPRLKYLNSVDDWELAESKDEAIPGVMWDSDDAVHMTWMYDRALERGKEFGIEGVTYQMTMQVTKNIIPAIASTNALISAACVNEALKFTSRGSYSLDNWLMYMGQNGCYGSTTSYKKEENCPVCGEASPVNIDKTSALSDLIGKMKEDHKLADPSLMAPSVGSGVTLFSSNPFLRAQTEANLKKTLDELLQGQDGAIIHVTDSALPNQPKFRIVFTEGAFWTPPEEA